MPPRRLACSPTRRPPRPTRFPYTTLFRSHAVLHDPVTGSTYCPLMEMPQNKASFSGQYVEPDRKSTRLKSSHVSTSYAVFGWKKKPPSDQHRKRGVGREEVVGHNAGRVRQ